MGKNFDTELSCRSHRLDKYSSRKLALGETVGDVESEEDGKSTQTKSLSTVLGTWRSRCFVSEFANFVSGRTLFLLEFRYKS